VNWKRRLPHEHVCPPIPGAVSAELGGEQLILLPQKAAFWPRERMLIIADIHFGKAAAFRSFGIPVPKGTTSENLHALDELIELTGARHILFLGDFLHARAAHAASTQAAMLAWRRRRCELILTLVRGNHDKHAGDPAAQLGIDLVDEPYTVGRIPSATTRTSTRPAMCWPATCIRCMCWRHAPTRCACRALLPGRSA
jgi:DNA ligase-associated metallophosphoesterase